MDLNAIPISAIDHIEVLRDGESVQYGSSDFGRTLDGKLTGRVQPDRQFVLRASASSGFRAPSRAQSFFSSTATNFLNLGQGLVPVESLTLPVTSARAQPLKPENSRTSAAVWPSRRSRRCR